MAYAVVWKLLSGFRVHQLPWRKFLSFFYFKNANKLNIKNIILTRFLIIIDINGSTHAWIFQTLLVEFASITFLQFLFVIIQSFFLVILKQWFFDGLFIKAFIFLWKVLKNRGRSYAILCSIVLPWRQFFSGFRVH